MFTDNEVLELNTVIVRDNESLTHVQISRGTYGAGNTNTSGYSGGSYDKPIEEYNGQTIFRRSANSKGMDIVAAVEDVLYIIVYSYGNERVVRLNLYENYSESRGVAYDTYELFSVTPISKTIKTIQTDAGTYVGTSLRGIPEGKGTYTYNEDDPEGRLICEGFFKNGAPDRRCRIVYRDGSSYEGWIKNGRFDDRGEFHYPNGEYYIGYFQDGQLHGAGVLYHADGKVKHNGWWKNGKISK